jgi:hypothetical protein
MDSQTLQRGAENLLEQMKEAVKAGNVDEWIAASIKDMKEGRDAEFTRSCLQLASDIAEKALKQTKDENVMRALAKFGAELLTAAVNIDSPLSI